MNFLEHFVHSLASLFTKGRAEYEAGNFRLPVAFINYAWKMEDEVDEWHRNNHPRLCAHVLVALWPAMDDIIGAAIAAPCVVSRHNRRNLPRVVELVTDEEYHAVLDALRAFPPTFIQNVFWHDMRTIIYYALCYALTKESIQYGKTVLTNNDIQRVCRQWGFLPGLDKMA